MRLLSTTRWFLVSVALLLLGPVAYSAGSTARTAATLHSCPGTAFQTFGSLRATSDVPCRIAGMVMNDYGQEASRGQSWLVLGYWCTAGPYKSPYPYDSGYRITCSDARVSSPRSIVSFVLSNRFGATIRGCPRGLNYGAEEGGAIYAFGGMSCDKARIVAGSTLFGHGTAGFKCSVVQPNHTEPEGGSRCSHASAFVIFDGE